MKLRVPRFSMRVLLLLMLVIGAALGVVGRKVTEIRSRKQRTKEIVERLQSKGAEVYFSMPPRQTALESIIEWFDGQKEEDPRLVRIRLGSYDLADFESIAKLERLEELEFWHPKTCDAWLQAVANSSSLERVWVADGICTARGASALAESKSPLSHLMLNGILVDDEFLRSVAKHPQIQSLYIDGDKITADGLGQLANAKSLTHLHLTGGTKLASGFEKLAGHPSLRSLDLTKVWFEKSELTAFSKLDSVSSLRIQAAKFPRGILKAAATMPRLRTLMLDGSLDESEDLSNVDFAMLESYSTGDSGDLCDGLLNQLAKCKTLSTIHAPRWSTTPEELLELAKVRNMFTITVYASPSKEAVNAFQKAQPYCVYIDGQWGVFQPKVGINPARMGGGVRKDSIVAPAGMK